MEKRNINDLFVEKVILPGQPVTKEDLEATVQNMTSGMKLKHFVNAVQHDYLDEHITFELVKENLEREIALHKQKGGEALLDHIEKSILGNKFNVQFYERMLKFYAMYLGLPLRIDPKEISPISFLVGYCNFLHHRAANAEEKILEGIRQRCEGSYLKLEKIMGPHIDLATRVFRNVMRWNTENNYASRQHSKVESMDLKEDFSNLKIVYEGGKEFNI